MNDAPEWIVKSSAGEYRTRSLDDLREYARSGRLLAGDYVFHPLLQRWLYGREVEELRSFFGGAPHTGVAVPAGSAMRGQMVCTSCGFIGKPRFTAQGSGCVELTLWLLLIVPGLIYTVWRSSTKLPQCPKCGAFRTMIPVDSPRGRQLVK